MKLHQHNSLRGCQITEINLPLPPASVHQTEEESSMGNEPSTERLLRDAKRVLENPFWVPELMTGESYSRLHDDHDGTYEGHLIVHFSEDSDAHVMVDTRLPRFLRFRNFMGGGKSLRVRNALILLAWAIKLDNQDYPDTPPTE